MTQSLRLLPSPRHLVTWTPLAIPTLGPSELQRATRGVTQSPIEAASTGFTSTRWNLDTAHEIHASVPFRDTTSILMNFNSVRLQVISRPENQDSHITLLILYWLLKVISDFMRSFRPGLEENLCFMEQASYSAVTSLYMWCLQVPSTLVLESKYFFYFHCSAKSSGIH